MRVLALSNSINCPSGYGTQVKLMAQMLPKLGHEVAVAAFHGIQGSPVMLEGILNYPGTGEDPYSQDILRGHYQNWRADLLITLMDAWVLDGARLQGMNVAHWMPVDCDPLSHMDRRILDVGGARPIAMSRFGERVLSDAGYDPLYVPHGIDTQNIFKPMPEAERAKTRTDLGFDGHFIVGLAAANQDPLSRKAMNEQFMAFAAFRKRHPEAVLLVHSRVETRNGLDLIELAKQRGILDAVKFGSQYDIAAGTVTQADMARWYGLCDVVTNCSMGEGFGLAAIEAQACGTPVVLTDFSAMSELCGAGWLVRIDPLDDVYWNKGHKADWARPRPSRILAAYEKAYRSAGGLRGRAREWAMRYDAERVLNEFWAPALKTLEAGL